jgi:import inner membrane translocase subunit TIM44
LDILPLRRSFHSTAIRCQQQKQRSQSKEQESKEPSSSGPESEEAAGEGKEKEKENESQKENKDAPPPPPHGDKTPWQVFTETLRSEFKKSKEWNESTKALASSAHQLTESESVKRARAAYEAASSSASSTTSSALKSTGRAIGQGAAWTWETPVVKGIRKGVSVTGKGIEKVTRPVRETQAYKTAVGGVKEAIDDGSSSRYGGWVEKEERRRQRQLREENELKSGHSSKMEKMEEDPK